MEVLSAFVSCHSDTSLLSVVFSSVIQAGKQSASHVAPSARRKSVRSVSTLDCQCSPDGEAERDGAWC